MKNALILLAGGIGKRLKKRIPKQFVKIGNYNLIEYFLKNLDKDIFESITIAVNIGNRKKYLSQLKKDYPFHNINFVNSGPTRQESTKNGLVFLKKINPKNVLIHDSARPLASNKLFRKILKSLEKNISCSPYIDNNDLIKFLPSPSKKTKILNIQTPQGFQYKNILNAHLDNNLKNFKDDTSLIEAFGIKTKFIKGEKTNLKITYKEDFEIFKSIRNKEFRYGIGYDIHKIDYKSKKLLTLCGVKIPFYPLIGHSDADVGYHAICDSILGALSLRDIGYHFNNKNIKWKNANSSIFLIFCSNKLKQKKYSIVNLDINFICEKPKISKYINAMKKNISKILKIEENNISIKSTTNEKIGFIGKGEGIAAESIVLIKND